MRITGNMMIGTTLRNLGVNAGRMNDLQTQLSSQSRINRLSDDPLGVITSLQSRSRLYAMEQHTQNLDDSWAWLEQVETGLMDLNKIVTEMYVDTVDAATDAKNSSDRKAIAAKVKEYRDQLVQVANTSIGDKYVFGGYNATKAPFEVVDGVLYFNGYNMYANAKTELNPEQFSSDALNALNDAALAGAPATAQDVVNAMKDAQAAMQKVISGAEKVYNSRLTPDATGAMVKPSAQDMITAMTNVFADNAALWSPEQQAAGQAAIDAAQKAMDAGGDMKTIMTGLDAMNAKATKAIESIQVDINHGVISDVAGAQGAIQTKKDAADAAALKAVEATNPAMTELGLAYEENKKYEVEIGYGQLMNITMNGVEVFGTGDNNLYKVLDDLYNALNRDFVDTSFGVDAYASTAVNQLDTIVQAIDPTDTLAQTQATVASVATAMKAVIGAGLSVDGSNVANVITAMENAVNATWSTEQKAAAKSIIDKAKESSSAALDKTSITNGLTAMKNAIDKTSAAVAALDPSTQTTADAQALVSADQKVFNAAYATSTDGKKTGSTANDITGFVSKLQEAQKDMMSLLSIIGGRTNRIEIVQSRYAIDEINYTERISKVEDADPTEVIMWFKMAESVYNAALSAGARIIQPTLMDFLR